MGDWFSLYTLVAFALGVALSAMVKSKVSAAKSTIGA